MSETATILPLNWPSASWLKLTGSSVEANPESSSEPPSLDSLGFLTPHPAQQHVLATAKRFNTLNCGRRWGKTLLAQRLLADAALNGSPVAYLCPTYKMLTQVWRDLSALLPQARRLVSEYRMELPGGGSIDMWSGDDAANAIRGRKYQLVIVDEAALIPGLMAAWEKSIRPTLTDLRGSAWFISTPRRGGTFEEFYQRGQGAGDEWASWQMPTLSNPYIDPLEIEAARAGMAAQSFAQEYEADFESSESDLVHPNFDRLVHTRVAQVSWAKCQHRIVGIDPGGGDPTAIVPIGTWKQEAPGALNAGLNFHQYGEFYRRGDVSTEDLIQYLGKLHSAGALTKVLVGETGGNVITNSLLRAGFPAERFLGTRDAGLETVNWLLEAKRLTIGPECANSLAEFGGYRWAKRRDGETGERYATSTTVDHHADAMDARRYALLWAVAGYENGGALAAMGSQQWGKVAPVKRGKVGKVTQAWR